VSAGYSGTPLAKKLGIKSGSIVFTIAAPREHRSWLAPIPENVSFVTKPSKAGCDLVHLFATSLAELKRDLPKARAAMKPDGAAKMPTDVTEDEVRRLALSTDLVDVKVCAVTDIWSGLKLVVRKHLR
jgi:hypothetical protein